MSEFTVEEVEGFDGETRYELFLSVVAEERELWLLVNDKNEFLKIHSEDHGIVYLPVWPNIDFAQAAARSSAENLVTKSLTVPEFLAKWVPGLEGDGLEVGVFPSKNMDIVIVQPLELQKDLQQEFSNTGF